MKKFIYSIASIALVAIILIGAQTAKANPSTITTFPLTGLTATTTGAYLTAGTGTTTAVAYIERYDQLDLNMFVEGSTTASVLNIQVDYSDDTNCSVFPLACNWYRESYDTTTASLRVQSNASMRTWAPVSNATTTQNTKIINLGARYIRFGFGAQGANLRVWAQVAGKVQNP